MADSNASTFRAKLLRPARPGKRSAFAFVVLPRKVSATLPRRGRTSVDGTMNGFPFRATLEPDGQLSHWLMLSQALRKAAGVDVGDTVTIQVRPVDAEPEPQAPQDLLDALAASPAARATWDDTTTIARVDWIHWIESARQAGTRERRVANARDMLSSGKKRVCCFDPSGFYSKSLCAPEAAD